MLYTNRSVDQLYQRNLLAAQRRLARPQPPPPTPPQEHRTSHRHPGRERVPNRQGENGSSPPQKGPPRGHPARIRRHQCRDDGVSQSFPRRAPR
jgi:hypothetical protein